MILICENDNTHIYDSEDFHTTCEKCRSKQMKQFRTFAEVKPELVNEWDFAKNFPLTPSDITYGSGKKYSWVCSIDPNHKWEARPKHRSATEHTGCPRCLGRFKPTTPRGGQVATDLVNALMPSDPAMIDDVQFDLVNPATKSFKDKLEDIFVSALVWIFKLSITPP